jgi:Mg2+ and Co2+ transporter CorA
MMGLHTLHETPYVLPLYRSHPQTPSTISNSGRILSSSRTKVATLKELNFHHDNTMRIYEWHVHESDSEYKRTLASEQLEEAKESRATAISLGKRSNLAFLYLPINVVGAMLGMNLSIYGQGEVLVWVYLLLVFFFQSPDIPSRLPT